MGFHWGNDGVCSFCRTLDFNQSMRTVKINITGLRKLCSSNSSISGRRRTRRMIPGTGRASHESCPLSAIGSGRAFLTRPVIFKTFLTRPDPTRPDPTRKISNTSWPDKTLPARF